MEWVVYNWNNTGILGISDRFETTKGVALPRQVLPKNFYRL